MKVFITGGTGYLGSALVEHLLSAGHEVSGLGRSEASLRALVQAGVTPVAASLDDTEVLYDAAASADAIIHAAVDYTMSEESTATELAAVSALTKGAGAAGGRALVGRISSGEVPSISARMPRASALAVRPWSPPVPRVV